MKEVAIELNPETAPIVRSIFDRYLNGGSLRAIALDLTRRGIPTPSGIGQTWRIRGPSHSQQPELCGQAPRSETMGTAIARPALSLSAVQQRRVIVLPDVAPAIVSEEEFTAVQGRFTVNKPRGQNNPNPERYLLRTGYVRCGYCGYALGASPLLRRGAPLAGTTRNATSVEISTAGKSRSRRLRSTKRSGILSVAY